MQCTSFSYYFAMAVNLSSKLLLSLAPGACAEYRELISVTCKATFLYIPIVMLENIEIIVYTLRLEQALLGHCMQ